MRNVSSALTMGLIIAATTGLVATYAFAAEPASGSTAGSIVVAQAAPTPAAPSPATTGHGNGQSNSTSGPANAGNAGDPSDNKVTQATTPDNTLNKSSNADSGMNKSDTNQTGQVATPTTNDQSAQTQQPMRHHLAMSRKNVEQVQAALASSGHDVTVDGVWGPKTTEALKDFQKAHGLKATGRLDHATRGALPKST